MHRSDCQWLLLAWRFEHVQRYCQHVAIRRQVKLQAFICSFMCWMVAVDKHLYWNLHPMVSLFVQIAIYMHSWQIAKWSSFSKSDVVFGYILLRPFWCPFVVLPVKVQFTRFMWYQCFWENLQQKLNWVYFCICISFLFISDSCYVRIMNHISNVRRRSHRFLR